MQSWSEEGAATGRFLAFWRMRCYRGYAASLVWGVTQALLAQRIRPMLYADADYAASNACYLSVGYAPQGEIWTVGDGLTPFRKLR